MNFDKDSISPGVKSFVNNNYLKKPDVFDVQKINNASKAAGPLAEWVSSIVKYSEIFLSITPLRNELKGLQEEESIMIERKQGLDEQVVKLEGSIESLALEYRDLIVKVEKIKSDMSSVQIKVKRSVDLIKNLSSERVRWEESSQNFVNQMSALLGDCLFASGFMTYIGFFDHFYRNYLLIEWKSEID